MTAAGSGLLNPRDQPDRRLLTNRTNCAESLGELVQAIQTSLLQAAQHLSRTNMDRPASPRPIDWEIAEANGESVSLDAARANLEASKASTNQSPQEIIVERTREIGRLRAEVAYLQEVRKLGEYLHEEVECVIDRLQLAVIAFHKGWQQIEDPNLELSSE